VSDQRGVALIIVLLVLALLAVVVTESAYSARLEASMVAAYRDGVVARHLAEAGVHQAIREILGQAQVTAVDGDGALVFYRSLPGQQTPTRESSLTGSATKRRASGSTEPTPSASTGSCRRSTWTARGATSSPIRSRTGVTATSCTAPTAPRAIST
jgi:Tfp pilus assembly protein PilX